MTGNNISKKDKIVDLASDEKFQDWILHGYHTNYWSTWLVQHREYRDCTFEASKLVRALKTTPIQSERQNLPGICKVTKASERRDTAFWPTLFVSKSLRYAATISLLALFCWWGIDQWSGEPNTVIYTTGLGEQKEFILPDQTHITLNANSSIEVYTDWQDVAHRRVDLLKGEAFFEVTKKSRSRFPKFKVFSGQLTVEVLGTTFTVKSRRRRTDVALLEGKVNILLEGKKVTEMQVGNTFSYIHDVRIVQNSKGARNTAAWIEKKLHLENTSMVEIAKHIEDLFGVPVQLDNSVASKELSGELPLENLEVLLAAIEIALDVHASYDQGRLLIRKKNN